MKTKQILYIAALLLLGSSCKKVLDRMPQDAITDLNFWSSIDNLKLYCNNFYSALYVPNIDADERSDNCVKNTPNTWLYGDVVVPASGGGWDNSDWSNIRNANYFLLRYREVVDDPVKINQYVGEIRFFRAYEYFNKVKTFGDVPWINQDLNVNDTTFLYKQRTPRQTVIDSVIEDLNFAVNNLPEPNNAELGRLHKYAALQLLARVNLYQGTWMKYRSIAGWEAYLNKAVNAARQMMQSNRYEIVRPAALYYFKTGDLVDAKTNTHAAKDYPLYYREQFITEDLTGNKECVLPKIYLVNVLTSGLSRTSGESGTGISKDLIEDFLCDDGLPVRLSPRYKGDDSTTLEFQNRDPRLRNMIDNRFLPTFLNNTSPTSNYFTTVNSGSPTGYLSMKFRSPIPQQNEANQTTYDMFVFRYAEVLLIYAEALAELGTITQADLDKSVNLLRARLDEPSLPNGKMARLLINPPADPAATTIAGRARYGYAVSPLIYEIRRERRIELAFEGFRWDDIVRWNAGKLIENPKTVYGIVASTAVQNMYNSYFNSNVFLGVNTTTFADWDGKQKKVVAPYTRAMRTWNDKLYLSPIPTDQITLGQGSLTQNPGW
ncbi:RagB/SusD family nutrient uptake outer membrane protein [Niabella beijingensis]|uniref:RagB/SusD family nutrient uptake outer membrane protein n=1 Tax=Niabella beijingensis TaxID=2872700 RepID=UPI001CBED3BC|nr:RagB/SusD family nutrient uptake outer membrane protein [Niabella beijingensis]MBZ4192149.1 RagB/SusD family nutrient uptake outer membrane protein [Niabella beijingensis]